VEQALFSITCTTCRARLRVRSEEAVGQIHECPRCGSMVEVVPPEDWEPALPPIGVDGTPEIAAAEGAATGELPLGAKSAAGAEAEPLGTPIPGVSHAELAWRKWLLLGAVPVAGLVVVVGLCSVFLRPDRRPGPEQPDSGFKAHTSTVQQHDKKRSILYLFPRSKKTPLRLRFCED